MSHRDYIYGTDILGDMGTGGAPSLPLEPFGPASSGGTYYTDSVTIKAVQRALIARGFPVGYVDGVFGPNTEAALFKFNGHHGPPDDTVLAQLGVKAGVGPVRPSSSGTGGRTLTEIAIPTPLAPVSASFLGQPAWAGAPVKVWQAGLGGLAVVSMLGALYSMLRR